MEKFVRDAKPHVATGDAMDKWVLDDSFAAMDKKLAVIKPSAAATILASRTMRLAAAAAAILVTSLLLMPQRHAPNQPGPPPAAQTPARMLSMMSLRTTYQRGGWEALDQQFRDTLGQFGLASSSLSMQQLLEGSNGS
jgi:hypothetical protein